MERRALDEGPVAQICRAAYARGLDEDALESVVDVLIKPGALLARPADRLMNSLYPASKVPDGVVIKVAGCLGQSHNKPAEPIQAGLLRWLVMVFELLADQKTLFSVYSAFFNSLDLLSLR